MIANIKVCVIIPVYNNEKTIGDVIDRCKEQINDVIVINDGSNDGTTEEINKRNVIHHKFEANQGKGSALKKGFEIAYENGFDYAISLDGDGQHYPEDIPKFINHAKNNQDRNTIIIGTRDFGENVTGRSKFGRVWSNFWCNFLTQKHIKDAQSGFRLYPLKKMRRLKLRRSRYDFETEVLVKALWKGCSVAHLPVSVHYDNPQERVSHFRGVYDNTRITFLFFKLILMGIFEIPINLIRRRKNKNEGEI
jgi:glycosyltransferase involved in cell wall biosynthesis